MCDHTETTVNPECEYVCVLCGQILEPCYSNQLSWADEIFDVELRTTLSDILSNANISYEDLFGYEFKFKIFRQDHRLKKI